MYRNDTQLVSTMRGAYRTCLACIPLLPRFRCWNALKIFRSQGFGNERRKGWYLCTTLFVVSRLVFCKYPRVFRRVWHGISDPVSVINIANRYDGTDSVFVLYKNDLEYGGKLTLLRLVHCPLARMAYVRLWSLAIGLRRTLIMTNSGTPTAAAPFALRPSESTSPMPTMCVSTSYRSKNQVNKRGTWDAKKKNRPRNQSAHRCPCSWAWRQ